jgi:hypothetical protein
MQAIKLLAQRIRAGGLSVTLQDSAAGAPRRRRRRTPVTHTAFQLTSDASSAYHDYDVTA